MNSPRVGWAAPDHASGHSKHAIVDIGNPGSSAWARDAHPTRLRVDMAQYVYELRLYTHYRTHASQQRAAHNPRPRHAYLLAPLLLFEPNHV